MHHRLDENPLGASVSQPKQWRTVLKLILTSPTAARTRAGADFGRYSEY